jgi:catechol 2,3-dioxygenase-like lactoylglutathione lyase family enzyme
VGGAVTILNIWHVAFTVGDLERSIAFYELLGLRLRNTQPQTNAYTRKLVGYPDADLRVAFLELPGGLATNSGHALELIQYLRPSGEPIRPERYQPGAAHLAFEVNDLQSEYERLSAAGVAFLSDPVDIVEGVNSGGRTVYLFDPDGITLEFHQAPPPHRRRAATFG